MTAGIYAMRAALTIVLIEQGVPGGQVAITKEVENYPGFIEIGGFDLCDKFLQHAKHSGLEIIEQEAVATEPGIEYHAVRLADGTLFKAHAVVLAAADGCTAALAAAPYVETRKGGQTCQHDGFSDEQNAKQVVQ